MKKSNINNIPIEKFLSDSLYEDITETLELLQNFSQTISQTIRNSNINITNNENIEITIIESPKIENQQ